MSVLLQFKTFCIVWCRSRIYSTRVISITSFAGLINQAPISYSLRADTRSAPTSFSSFVYPIPYLVLCFCATYDIYFIFVFEFYFLHDIRYTTYDIRISGGDERDRTAGLRRARAALSQLSYIPISIRRSSLVSGIP